LKAEVLSLENPYSKLQVGLPEVSMNSLGRERNIHQKTSFATSFPWLCISRHRFKMHAFTWALTYIQRSRGICGNCRAEHNSE